ncbi:MAG: hypothetical protein NTW90_06810 [Nitrosospira sp.]|nr:hypothetical protein [Nitrosospira sp.]
MGYATLIKYALWALLIAAVIGGIWLGVHNIYQTGYTAGTNAERTSWEQREIVRKDALAKAVAEAVKAIAAARAEQVAGLTGALDHAAQQNTKLGRDIAALRNSDGLSFSSNMPRCAAANPAAEDEGPGLGGGGASRVRLPREIEESLYGIAEDAQRVVIQYETCRRTLTPLVEVEDGQK